MPPRLLITAFFGSLALNACSPTAPPAPVQIEDEAILSDPLSTLIPWDETREEIHSTESGLQYVILNSGDTSGDMPTANDSAKVHYEGRLAEDGT